MCLKLLKKSIMAAVMNSNPKRCWICIQHSCMHQLERKVTKQKIIFTHNYTIIPATPLLSLVVVMESFNDRIFKDLASMSQRVCMNHTSHTAIKINGEQQWSLCELTQTRTVALFKAHGLSSGPDSIQTVRFKAQSSYSDQRQIDELVEGLQKLFKRRNWFR